MNIVDSCGWLEYFADGPNADKFAVPLSETDNLIVPSICVYEVFKVVLRERNEDAALQAAALMRQGKVVDLSFEISIQSARLGYELKIPMADSIILATARIYQAVVWTQDKHFKNFEGVNYFSKIKGE